MNFSAHLHTYVCVYGGEGVFVCVRERESEWQMETVWEKMHDFHTHFPLNKNDHHF